MRCLHVRFYTLALKFDMNEKVLFFANLLVSRLVNAIGMLGRVPARKLGANPKILVVKWDEIGDMAAAVHVFGTLRSAYPGAEITVLCKPFVASLIANDPAVDALVTSVDAWTQRYDVVVELRGTWKTLRRSLALRTMPKYRVDRGWIRFLQRGKQPHEVVTNYRVIMPLLNGTVAQFRSSESENENGVEAIPSLSWLASKRKLYPSEAELAEAQYWIEWAKGKSTHISQDSKVAGDKNLTKQNQSSGYAILHTGARRALRRWPVERYVALSKWLQQEKGLLPIWVGTAEEEAQLDEAFTSGAVGEKWVAPAGSSLLSFYAFIASSQLYVGNESGPLQLADIAGVPLVAIYGPGVPDVFYPLSSRAQVLHEVLDCNPCDQVVCIRPGDRCIDRIGLGAVQLAVNTIIRTARAE